MRRFFPLLLLATPAFAAEPAPPPQRLPDERGFPTALKAALCDYFEYLGGESGTTRSEINEPSPRRFWFARLRAKRPGVYTIRYTARLNPPGRGSLGEIADEVEYRTDVVVATPGTKRVFLPQWVGGPTLPNAVVGDTLILPVHTDAGRTDYRFPLVQRRHAGEFLYYLPQVLPTFNDWTYRTIDELPAVRVSAVPQLGVVNSWRGTYQGESHPDWYSAYLEFAAPGSFNLAARLSHEPAGAPGRQTLAALSHQVVAREVPSYPFRVVPAGRPVTVLLGSYARTDHYRNGGSYSPEEQLAYGTQEVRVGDTVVLDFGIDIDPPTNGAARSAVVEALPFRDVPHYTPR